MLRIASEGEARASAGSTSCLLSNCERAVVLVQPWSASPAADPQNLRARARASPFVSGTAL